MQYTRTRSRSAWTAKAEVEEPVKKNTDPIIFYCDHQGMDLNNVHTMNRFLMQDILGSDGTVDRLNFTHHPLIDVGVLSGIDRGVEIRTFDQGYLPGRDSIVHIGLMSGWTKEKLDNIKNWFDNPRRSKLFDDPNCRIVLDYSLEGFTEYAYRDIWYWIEENRLHNRVIYISGASNCEEIYQRWCKYNNVAPNMTCAWYGFFADWVARRVPSDIARARYNLSGPRIMCLNRRPHEHRMLLAALLERNGLIEKIAVSFPAGLNEDADYQIPGYDNVAELWARFVNKSHGWIDYLDPAMQRLLKKLPLTADTNDFNTNHAGDLNAEFYSQYPINVITETIFFTRGVFPSEKIWKPIAVGQIFIPQASSYFLRELRRMGFKTFSPWIDESYDLIDDDHERAVAIVKEISRLVALPDNEFKYIVDQCQPIVEYNRQLFFNSTALKKIISREFLEKINNV